MVKVQRSKVHEKHLYVKILHLISIFFQEYLYPKKYIFMNLAIHNKKLLMHFYVLENYSIRIKFLVKERN
jgi:hypothetical protein